MNHLVLIELLLELSELSALVLLIVGLFLGVAGLLVAEASLVAFDGCDHHHDLVLALLLVGLDGNVVVDAEVVPLLLLEHFNF